MTSSKPSIPDESPRLAEPVLAFDLPAEAALLREGSPWELRGHNAKTLVKHPDLRLVLIVLRAGAEIQRHQTDHRISVQTVAGHVRLNLPEQVVDLPAGSVLVLDHSIPHDVVAEQDSTVLLTMSIA